MVEKLYEQYYSELVSWCKSMTQNASVAEDLVQEAFLRALHHAEELDNMGEKQGRAWLYRTVKNLYVDRLRHGRYEMIMEELPEEAKNTDYDEFENEQILSNLPEEERKLFVMRYLEGYKSTELGEIFAIPPATVRMRLASARRRLRREWEE